jgi:IS4 transposase
MGFRGVYFGWEIINETSNRRADESRHVSYDKNGIRREVNREYQSNKAKKKGQRYIVKIWTYNDRRQYNTFPLPDELSKEFPGNVSRGKKKSQAKIHALYNFTGNNFSFLDIHNFTENDQSLSSTVLAYVHKWDLLLRDMGFLVLSVLKEILAQGAYVISRKNAQTKVYDIETEQEINLAKTLRKNHLFDKIILVGKKEKVEMRLVILPVPLAQANQRRRKAKKDRDKRLNHSKEYYELLGYVIFITNIPQTMCVATEIQKLYGLRWQIEIIFKSWKSCFSLEKLIPTKCKNPERIYSMICLFLLFIILFQVVWVNIYYNKSNHNKGHLRLSLLKMAKFFMQHFCLLLVLENDKKIIKQIKSQCRYDSRKDRLNTMEKYEKFAA